MRLWSSVKQVLQAGQDSLAATYDENLRQQLELDGNSRVVIIATEGPTDPEVYRNLVGASPEAVLAEPKP